MQIEMKTFLHWPGAGHLLTPKVHFVMMPRCVLCPGGGNN